MAKPLRQTPTLTGDAALQFVAQMQKTEKRGMTKKEKDFLHLITE